jgi:hypothetical protein
MKHKNVRKVGYGGIISAVSAVVGIASFFKQQEAADDAKEANEKQRQLQERINSRNAQRQRIAALREERINRASILSNVAPSGVVAGGTSPVMGGLNSVTSQFGANISNINTNLASASYMGDAMTDYYNATGSMQQWQSIGSAAGTIFANADAIESGFNKLKTWATS